MNLITGWDNDNIEYMPFIKGHPQFNTGRTWLKKGHSLNKGRKLSKEHKQKLSKAHKGQIPWNIGKKGIHLAPDTEFVLGSIPWNKGIKGYMGANKSSFKKGDIPYYKGKHIPQIMGERHWNWQNGKTQESMKIRKSLEYKQWRKAVFERDNYTCQICFKRGGNMEVDHIKAFAYYPELRFEVSNGRTLCIKCHRGTSNYGEKAKN